MTGAHAARRARFAIGLLLVPLSAAPAFAADASARVALVRAMYQAYAWEAVMARPSHTPLFDQPATVLRGYFDEPLTRLILANQACERRTREICRLDAMPLWDSADPNASDLVVETAADAPDEVRVRFRRFGESGWTEIRFVFATTRDGVRIRDIRYPGGASLLGMLALPDSAGIQPGTATTMPHRIPIASPSIACSAACPPNCSGCCTRHSRPPSRRRTPPSHGRNGSAGSPTRLADGCT